MSSSYEYIGVYSYENKAEINFTSTCQKRYLNFFHTARLIGHTQHQCLMHYNDVLKNVF